METEMRINRQNLQRDKMEVEGLVKRLSKVEDQLGRIMYWLKSKYGQDFDQDWDPVVIISKIGSNQLDLDSKVEDGIRFDPDNEDLTSPLPSSADPTFNARCAEWQTDNCLVKIEVSDYNSSCCEVSCPPNETQIIVPEEKKLKIRRLPRFNCQTPKSATSTSLSRKYVRSPITCEICGVCVLGRKRYYQHQAAVHQISRSTLRCSKCPKTFSTSSSLFRHYKSSHTEPDNANLCSVCGTSFPDAKKLSSHEKRSHSVHIPTTTTRLCQHCGRSFRSIPTLKRHENAHVKPKTRKDAEKFAKVVCEFYESVDRDKSKTVHKFVQSEGKSRGTIYAIIKAYEVRGHLNFRKITGCPPRKSTLEAELRIVEEMKKNPSISCRQLAKKLGIPLSTISFIKIKKLGIRSTKKNTDKEDDKQERCDVISTN